MDKDVGRVTGSRASTEPSSRVSALTGFDPARDCISRALQIADDGSLFNGEKLSKIKELLRAATNAPPAAHLVIAYIAKVSNDVAWQAGVGGMETAGSIVSFLAANPDKIGAFLEGGSVLGWPFRWHAEGCLSWHGQNGGIHWPKDVASAIEARRAETQDGSVADESALEGDAQTPPATKAEDK